MTPHVTAWRLRRLAQDTGHSALWIYRHMPLALVAQFETCALYESHLESGRPLRWNPASDLNTVRAAELSATLRAIARCTPQSGDDELID